MVGTEDVVAALSRRRWFGLRSMDEGMRLPRIPGLGTKEGLVPEDETPDPIKGVVGRRILYKGPLSQTVTRPPQIPPQKTQRSSLIPRTER